MHRDAQLRRFPAAGSPEARKRGCVAGRRFDRACRTCERWLWGAHNTSSQASATTLSRSSTATQPGSSASVTSRRVLLLDHPTSRPPDAKQQFSYVGGAGPGPCFGAPTGPKLSMFVEPFPASAQRPGGYRVTPGQATYGQLTDLCFAGLGRGPVQVVVTGPDRFRLHGALPVLPRKDRFNSYWEPYDWVPGFDSAWPLGTYTVTATSSVGRASTHFKLVGPTEPGLRVLGPSTDPGHNSVAPNSLATIYLTGLRGLSLVRLTVYELPNLAGKGQFRSSTVVPVPPSGNFLVTMPTGHPNPSITFVVTAAVGGRTLYGAFNVMPPYRDPATIVGSLPSS